MSKLRVLFCIHFLVCYRWPEMCGWEMCKTYGTIPFVCRKSSLTKLLCLSCFDFIVAIQGSCLNMLHFIQRQNAHNTQFPAKRDYRILSVDERVTFEISKLGKSLTGVSWKASNTALRLGGSVGPCQQRRIGKVRNHDSQFDFRRRAR